MYSGIGHDRLEASGEESGFNGETGHIRLSEPRLAASNGGSRTHHANEGGRIHLMDKRFSGAAVVLILAGIVAGIFLFRGDGSEAASTRGTTMAAPPASITSSSTPVASPVPGASPIAGELDCTGIQAWTERVQTRFAETDAITATLQSKDDLAAVSTDELTRFITLLEAAKADQEADVPPSAGADTQAALLHLIQLEIDFFKDVLDAKTNSGDVGAIYDASIEEMQTAAGGVSVLVMTLAFTCIDAFE
jgi:hypothetical protein